MKVRWLHRVRRRGRKKVRSKIGWRVLAIYIVTLLLAGALATAMNLRMEERIKAQENSRP